MHIFKDLEVALTIGLVRLWGTVSVHGREGWRGQYAQPIALLDMWLSADHTHFVDIHDVAALYGIPCIHTSHPLWKVVVQELGAPSTAWFGPPIHAYDLVNTEVIGNKILDTYRCGCGFEKRYNREAEDFAIKDWIRHWESL